ncbi:MAG: hypothetical protein BA861_12760 [Desulfobacterales bacterium S3730MH5]|nr:MAG: hypothetical protein BA861_12760 [Desulfobacterales bacterium S3730MH5]
MTQDNGKTEIRTVSICMNRCQCEASSSEEPGAGHLLKANAAKLHARICYFPLQNWNITVSVNFS